MEVTRESFECIRRSFAMMALAMAANMPREKLFKHELVRVEINGIIQNAMQEVPKVVLPMFRAVRLPTDIADKLRVRVARGDVTTIVPQPEPFTWLLTKVGENELRCIYGIWVGRPASWRGKINPDNIPHLGALTVAEAEAKGIPVPNMPKE